MFKKTKVVAKGVATWLKPYVAANHIHISKMAHPFKKAYLQRPLDKSLDKKWFVCFYIFDEIKKKLVRKRLVISGKTLQEREQKADKFISGINELLESGAVINPKKAAESTVKPLEIKANISIISAIEHFLKRKEITLKPRSHETYRSNANTFIEFLKEYNLEAIQLKNFTNEYAHGFSDWLVMEKKLSNKSHNKMKGFCSALFNEFINREVITNNPFKRIQKLRVKQGKHRVFSPAQISEFRQLCEEAKDDAMWFFVCFIYYTFSRPHQEARMMRIEDIGAKTIRVSELNAKSSRVRHIQIPPPLEAMIEERGIRNYPPHFYVFSYGKPGNTLVGEAYWYERHKRYIKQMGLYKEGYDLYGWKHTGVTALYRATKDLKLVQEQCGHTDIKQTVEYLRDLGVFYYEGQIEKFPPI
ncbi:integrase [Runella defluvii]|uniref:Integrase n=1 Tax=Runella defluvii TaxID=370973 RepID=A0A7W5ZS87_9BACT|nr:site-specific integrase [Runella defluvii]MBB3842184.1 integrase [Runella defluvii]